MREKKQKTKANALYFYHATFAANLSSIKKTGLQPGHSKNWDISKPDVIYLSNDPDIAYSFCECAEDVCSDKYDSGIVVLAIPKAALNLKSIQADANILDGGNCFEYKEAIPPELLSIIKM